MTTKDSGKDVKRLTITAETARAEPDYSKTAAMLLAACREWYKSPENEQAYTDWKKNGRNKNKR